MSDKLSPVDEVNEFFDGVSRYKLVPRFGKNGNKVGYALREGEHNIYEFNTLDQKTAAEHAITFYDGAVHGHSEVDEWGVALQTMGQREKLKDLKSHKITAVTKPTIEELNILLMPFKYQVMPRPEPWEGEVRGYILKDMSGNEIPWELHSDDEALVTMFINILFYGISIGVNIARRPALRMRALMEWQPPFFDKAN